MAKKSYSINIGYHVDGDKPSYNKPFKVLTESLANNTILIAKPGSGKSFFLGRIIEELMIKTRAKCIIFDPNGDFRQIHKIKSEVEWANYGHELLKREEFSKLWEDPDISKRIRTSSMKNEDVYQQLKIWWPSISAEFFSGDMDTLKKGQLVYFHNLVKGFSSIYQLKIRSTGKCENFYDTLSRILESAKPGNFEAFKALLDKEYDAKSLVRGLKKNAKGMTNWIYTDSVLAIDIDTISATIEKFAQSACGLSENVHDDIQKYYFGKVNEFQTAGILHNEYDPESGILKKPRLEVIDLPSLRNRNTRLLVINQILVTEWERVKQEFDAAFNKPNNRDKRVPTFIVVDEAHNLVPDETRGAESLIREQFRTITAEGRKYGMYLFLVTQRPDKLDRILCSDFENVGLMSIASKYILKKTIERVGLDEESKEYEQCHSFKKGFVLLLGPWAKGKSAKAYVGFKRTIDGGRNINNKYWVTR